MNKNGIGNKIVYANTEDGITIWIQARYNPRTDHIGFGAGFQKSHGWHSGIINNKNCPDYLGVTIAEQLLVKVFNYVEVMPSHNKGYDIICNQGYKIDIKSSIKIKNRKAWMFGIKYNHIADYFLCLAFDNRQQLNPMYIWLIPSEKVNHLSGLVISESTIDKWSKYELTDKLDKVIGCCNIMKGDN